MEYLLMCMLGIMLGIVIGKKFKNNHPIGALRIDRSIPDEPPYLFIELYETIDDFSKRDFVVLDIKNEDFVPHK